MSTTSERTTFIYDVFISYRWITPDQEWVREILYPALIKASLKVCLDVNDFIPGRDVIMEMAGKESRHVLSIITPEYFEEGRFEAFENLSARRRDPQGINSFLIPLLLRPTAVPDRISGLITIDWTNPAYRNREWKKLLKVLNSTQKDAPLPEGMEFTAKGAEMYLGKRLAAEPIIQSDQHTPQYHKTEEKNKRGTKTEQHDPKSILRIYKESVKNVPLLKYSWILISTICILSFSAYAKLKNSDVFFYAFGVLFISFLGFVFSFLLKKKDIIIRIALYIFVYCIILTMGIAVLGLGSFIIWNKPTFYTRWFPNREGEVIKSSVNQKKVPSQLDTIDRSILRFGITLGWELAIYQFLYEFKVPKSRAVAPSFETNILLLLSQDHFPYNLKGISGTKMIDQVLMYYGVNSVEKHAAILLGIAARRTSLIGLSKYNDTNANLEKLAFSALREIDPKLLPKKNDFFKALKQRRPGAVVEVLDFIESLNNP